MPEDYNHDFDLDPLFVEAIERVLCVRIQREINVILEAGVRHDFLPEILRPCNSL